MTARLGDLRCLSCGHDPDSYNVVCGCASCHNVFAGSSRPSLRGSGGGRGDKLSGSPDRPSHSLPSEGTGRATRTRFNGWYGLAGIVALSTGWGAVHGWHESPWDLVAGAVLTGCLVVAGALWWPKDGR